MEGMIDPGNRVTGAQSRQTGAEALHSTKQRSAKFTTDQGCDTINAFPIYPDGGHFMRYFRLLRPRPEGILQQSMLQCGNV
jgi:hypothetical protein